MADVVVAPHKAGDPKPLALRSWMTSEAASELFKRAGKDFAAERLAANQPGFVARFSYQVTN